MENYEIIANIGKGSSGAVFLAKHLREKKLVAIKKIEIDENRRSRCKKSVVREAMILRRLTHPYIVECGEWFLDAEENMMHIVLEFCSGGTMQDMVRQARNKNTFFPDEKVLKWLAQIVSAVAYMHSKKILHRDLKTENVFIVKPDIAKLGDFGISKEIDHTLDMAQTCVGTPCYLSPELCQDIPYSSKSDVWALGCLLFEMAALKPAFDAANLVSLFYKIVKGEFADLPVHCSKDVLDIVNVILQKNPEDRPTAARLLDHSALAKYVSELRSDALPKIGRKSAAVRIKNSPEKKLPPILAEPREKNVDKLPSLEDSGTITNDDMERTIDGSGPSYAYNMFLSESNEFATAPMGNRAMSVLGVGTGSKGGASMVPKLFAYQAAPHADTGSPPPPEVETARPQTCPHSASGARTAPIEEENFTDTVVTWSGYGDRGSRHRSGRRRSDTVSLSSGTDESSDSDADNVNRRQRLRNERWRKNADSDCSLFSGDEDISEELVREEALGDDDIPEMIDGSGENCSGDSAHTGDEQSTGDNGRVLPGSAWLRSKRTQVLQRQQGEGNFGKNSRNNDNHKKKKVRLPGSSWLSKQQRAERENASQDADPIVLGQNNHADAAPKRQREESKRGDRRSGKIRNLPGSAWLKNSPSGKAPSKNKTSVQRSDHFVTKEPSMVLESFSSGSANEYSSPEKGKSDTDAEYDSDCSYPDDFEDYEDDFELSDDDFSDNDRSAQTQGKSSLDIVRRGCIDVLGEEVFDELAALFKKGLKFSEALCRFNTKKVDSEALEACYLLLQNR